MCSSSLDLAMWAPRDETPQLLGMIPGIPGCGPDGHSALGGTPCRPASHDAPAVTGPRRNHGPSCDFGVMQSTLNILLRVPRPKHVDTIQQHGMNVEGHFRALLPVYALPSRRAFLVSGCRRTSNACSLRSSKALAHKLRMFRKGVRKGAIPVHAARMHYQCSGTTKRSEMPPNSRK